MTAPTTRRVKVLKNFKDAGTGVSYKKNQQPELDEGSIANYEAAGLVKSPETEAAKSASK